MADQVIEGTGDVNPEGDNINTDDGGQKWYESLPEGVREHVQGFESAEALVNDYVDKKGKVPVVPKEAKEYKPVPKPEDLKEVPDENFNQFLDAMRGYAHSVGLTQKQFESTVKAELARQKGARDAQMSAAKKALEAGVKKLKEDWGNDYEANFKKADQVATALLPKDFKAFLAKTGLNNHPDFIKGMFELSKKVSEDVFITPEGDPDTGEPGGVKRDPVTGLPMLKYNTTKK